MRLKIKARGLLPYVQAMWPHLVGASSGLVKVAEGILVALPQDAEVNVEALSNGQVKMSVPSGVTVNIDKTVLGFLPVKTTERLMSVSVDETGLDAELKGYPLIRLEATE